MIRNAMKFLNVRIFVDYCARRKLRERAMEGGESGNGIKRRRYQYSNRVVNRVGLLTYPDTPCATNITIYLLPLHHWVQTVSVIPVRGL
ncbi:hypothetical protein J6590_006410 [Homalodisca vitripennis]|nr:hypothetical protein J6590_060201 [Homalodisca vitripennis]KAG8323399.1 hypothetical protein J6590_006410 [Homalodisca vitripennis]